MCITPEELQHQLGKFGHYCPVCLVLDSHLVDCSETAEVTHAAEYRGYYYKMCGDKHLDVSVLGLNYRRLVLNTTVITVLFGIIYCFAFSCS